MTHEEINVIIAESCGWTDIRPTTKSLRHRKLMIGQSPDPLFGCTLIPDYCNDLNAMHDAERGGHWKETDRYQSYLEAITFKAGIRI